MNEYTKIVQVIRSCETHKQLDVAGNMIGLYQNNQRRKYALTIKAYSEVIRKPEELRRFIVEQRMVIDRVV